MSEHLCHVKGCQEPCEAAKLMCAAHWWATPHPLRQAVRDNYRKGQHLGLARPSRAWMAAAKVAVRFHDA